jgi:preprotein translocase subunit Sec61beta
MLMADNKINLPSSGGGIVRYFDELTSKINLKPEVVMIIIALVIVFILLLQVYGNSLFGVA